MHVLYCNSWLQTAQVLACLSFAFIISKIKGNICCLANYEAPFRFSFAICVGQVAKRYLKQTSLRANRKQYIYSLSWSVEEGLPILVKEDNAPKVNFAKLLAMA